MNARSQRTIQVDLAIWKHPALQVCTARTRAHLIDLVFILQTSPSAGRAVSAHGVPLTTEQMAHVIGADAEDLQQDIDTLIRIGMLARDAKGLYSPEMVRKADLSAKRRQAGLRGGNPALRAAEAAPENCSRDGS